MNHLLSATALVATIALTPAFASANNYGSSELGAHERCKRDEDNRQILGGFAGAVLGGVVGSQVAGRGARTEGSVIAGTLGALAGAGIADKSIDCDPVYPQGQTYPSGSYNGGPTYSGGGYSTGSTYPSPVGTTTYGSTQTYQDRVTVSNHPVYSDPYYGAGAISQGSTYTSGSASYPPSGSNSQYVSQTYSSAPTTTYASVPATTYSTPTTSRVVHSSPRTTSYAPSYSSYSHHNPQFRTVRTYGNYGSRRARRAHVGHYHGRYNCDMHH